MDVNKFTQKVQSYLQSATELAQENSQQQLTPIHLGVVLFEDSEGLAKHAVQKATGDEETLR